MLQLSKQAYEYIQSLSTEELKRRCSGKHTAIGRFVDYQDSLAIIDGKASFHKNCYLFSYFHIKDYISQNTATYRYLKPLSYTDIQNAIKEYKSANLLKDISITNWQQLVINRLKKTFPDYDVCRRNEDTMEIRCFLGDVPITNSLGMSHTMTNVYIRFVFEGKYLRNFAIFRTSFTNAEYASNYVFSHVCSDFEEEKAWYSDFCFGDTQLDKTFHTFRDNSRCLKLNLSDIELFFIQIDSYLRWESLEGIPYRKLGDIRIAGNSFSLDDDNDDGTDLYSALEDLNFNVSEIVEDCKDDISYDLTINDNQSIKVTLTSKAKERIHTWLDNHVCGDYVYPTDGIRSFEEVEILTSPETIGEITYKGEEIPIVVYPDENPTNPYPSRVHVDIRNFYIREIEDELSETITKFKTQELLCFQQTVQQ